MSEHYSGNDPELGCFWIMVVGVILGLVVWFFAVIGFLTVIGVGR